MPGSKSMSPERTTYAREQFRLFVQRRFEGDQSAAGAALGVSQATVSSVISGAKGIGSKLLSGVAKIDPETAGAMLAGQSPPITGRIFTPKGVVGPHGAIRRQPLLLTDGKAQAAERSTVTDRQEQRERGLLSNVRKSLLKRYTPELVDAVVAGSEFIDAQGINELEAFDALEEQIKLVLGKTKLPEKPPPPHPKKPPKVGR